MSHKTKVQIIADQHLIINENKINIDDIETISIKKNGQVSEYSVKQGNETIGVRPGMIDEISPHDIIDIENQNNRLMELLKDATMVLHAVASETSFKFDNLHKKILEELNRNKNK